MRKISDFLYQITPMLNGHYLSFRFEKRTIEDRRQMNEIFDGAIREGQYRKAKFGFWEIYPEYGPLRKPVILNCRRLSVEIFLCNTDDSKQIFKDLLEWLQVRVVIGQIKQLFLAYLGIDGYTLLPFIDGLKQVFKIVCNN